MPFYESTFSRTRQCCGLRDRPDGSDALPPTDINPCFNGIWSASGRRGAGCRLHLCVLILVLMEYGLRVGAPMLLWRGRYGGLNPCFNGIWSASKSYVQDNNIMSVLILVLMEYGLRGWGLMPSKKWTNSLNPCFNGIWSASPFGQAGLLSNTRLNPCFNGIWSASVPYTTGFVFEGDCLNPCFNGIWSARDTEEIEEDFLKCLNPCFNGIWSARVKSMKICM